jgi:hypothetical protein
VHDDDSDRKEPVAVAKFRLPKKLLERLEDDAKVKRINVNTYVLQVLYSHVELHSPAIASGMLPFPKRILGSMMAMLDEQIIDELAREMAQKDFVDLAFMRKNKFTLESFIETLLVWARHSGFPVKDTSEGSSRVVTIKHDMGENWSVFMAKILETCLADLKIKGVKFGTPDDMLIITFGSPTAEQRDGRPGKGQVSE